MGNKSYKSPLHKLARFFERSRDGWKEKYGNVKMQNKCLKNRIRSLERTQGQWKQEVLQLREKVGRLQSEASKREKLHEEVQEKKVTTDP
jgi:predicted  nucleic acid-binding Zn-ribbon protein